MVEIKICGVKDQTTARAVIDSGANYMGIVTGTTDSPRHVPFDVAKDLMQFAKGRIRLVLVIRELSRVFIDRAVILDPDLVHFHKSGAPGLVERLQDEFGGGIIYGIAPSTAAENLSRVACLIRKDDIVLVDGSMGKGAWIDDAALIDTCQHIERVFHLRLKELFVAGGFNHSNVCSFLQRHEPRGIDASSGLETSPGVKNTALIKNFCDVIMNNRKQEWVEGS